QNSSNSSPEMTPSLSDLITALGTLQFERHLLPFLNQLCGAEHCAVFQFQRGELKEVYSASWDGTDTAHRQVVRYIAGQYWRRDPMISEAQHHFDDARPIIIRFDPTKFSDPALRALYAATNTRERMIVSRGSRDQRLSRNILSILRSGNPREQAYHIETIADVLISLIAKHEELTARRSNAVAALESIAVMERCMACAPEILPRREIEVCARILFGLSCASIAAQLRIGEESVATYRKRAFQRLEITTRRDLLIWYLNLWQAKDRNASAGRPQ
ncbi:MAG: LuxR C-terminal-related transcriptional regulator, partial [Thermomicrobiales bacterium]